MSNRQLVCLEFGPPENLTFEDFPVPSPGPGEVLVKITAAGVGFFDGLMVQGLYQIKPPLPYYPGSEFAGTVAEQGDGAHHFKVGTRVMGLSGGSFADYICVSEKDCTEIPSNLSDEVASGFCANYSTGLYGLQTCGQLQPGETALILGASGGIGSSGITIAKALGARVIAAASTQAKLDLALASGADAGVLYSKDDWRSDFRQALGEDTLNVVYDPVGGSISETAFRCLSPGGRFLVIGFASGTIPSIPLNLPLLKQSSIVGVDWGGAAVAQSNLTRGLLKNLAQWIQDKKLKPAPVTVRPLSSAPSALAEQIGGEVIGKLVLKNGA